MKRKMTIRDAAHYTPADSSDDQSHGSKPAFRFDIDLAELLRLLLRRRRWIIGVTGLVGFLAAVIVVMTPNRYTSEATILPSGKSDSFSAIKAMAGFAGMMGGGDGASSTLFPVILRSNLVVDSVLAGWYTIKVDGRTVDTSLADYLGIEDRDRLRRALKSATSINSDTRTGEINLAVETRHPELSQALVTEYMNRLEDYNLNSRRSEAKERVRYLSRELDSRNDRLRIAEDSLQVFQSRNRNWASTTNSALLMQLARLQREVEIKAKTVAYLIQEYEVAKLDAQKDVPVVRVLGEASLPTQKSGPFRTIAVLTSMFVAFGFVIVAIFVVDFVQNTYRKVDNQKRELLRGDLVEAFPRTVRLQSRLTRREHQPTFSVDS